MPVMRYLVSGMTCGHCVSAVTEEIGKLEGVTGVEVELAVGGQSLVRVVSTTELPAAAVAAAIEEAGYKLVESSR